MKRYLFALLLPIFTLATIWPVGDPNESRPIGNSWGAIQTFDPAYPYFHPGVDVMGVTPGQPVYAVADGQVKAWMTLGHDIYWRLAIADTITNDSCDGWLYAHLDPTREHKVLGDWVTEGEVIGYLVDWPGFHHLHWARIRGAGETWFVGNDYLWEFVDNPMVNLEPTPDTVPPIFYNTWQDELFSFPVNNTYNYLEPDNLSGDVDIIARIHDKTGMYWENVEDTIYEHLAPMEVWYEIHGPQATEPVRSFLLDGHLQDITDHIELIYPQDYHRCHAIFNWDDGREYYFFLTNTDGDSLRELSDYDSCWHTAEYVDGDYWVVVTAKDAVGNETVDSMQVSLVNGNAEGVEETENLKTFTVLTPFVSQAVPLSVICPSAQRLRIYDATGREQLVCQLSSSPKPQLIDVNFLPCGLYYIKVDSAVPIQRFVVVR